MDMGTARVTAPVDDTNLPIDPRGVLLVAPDQGNTYVVSMEQLTILSVEDYSRYRTAYRQVSDIVFGGVFSYFLVSAAELRTRTRTVEQAFADRQFAPQTRPEEAARWATALRAAVLSVTSALAYHQEQIYQLASELHEGPDVRAAAEAVFNELFDTNRGYRLLYSLRNLMTHHTMEVVALSARAFLVPQGHVETRFNLRIDRRVASLAGKLNAAAKREFVEMLHDPDVLDLLDEVYSPLSRANQHLSEILYPDLRLTCQTIMDFESLFQGKPGTRALVNDWHPEVPRERPQWTPWAPQVFDFASRYLAS